MSSNKRDALPGPKEIFQEDLQPQAPKVPEDGAHCHVD